MGRMAILLTVIGLLMACDRPPVTSDRVGTRNDPAPGNFRLEISDGLVSLSTHRVPMKDVLETIAHEEDFELVLEQPLREELTLQVQDLPLPEAIDRILRDRVYTLEYSDTDARTDFSTQYVPADAALRIARLWIPSSSRPGEDSEADSSAAAQDLDVATRLSIIVALAEDGTTQALAGLGDALSDPVPTVREEAVHAIEAIGGNQAALVLQQALMDPAPTVRAAVVEAYADIGGEESVNALAVALQDADPAIREAAVWALGEIDNPAATPYLRQALDDHADAVRDAAAQMLDELPDQTAATLAPGRESSLTSPR